jgi:hypothetical protein
VIWAEWTRTQHFMGRATIRVALIVIVLGATYATNARSGSGHGVGSSGNGGHGCAGHSAAPAGSHGSGIASHDRAGAGGWLHGHGGSTYGASYGNRVSAIDRELHERVVKTQQAKEAFRRAHPCPASVGPTGSCPGYVIDCVNPSPAEPARCLDASNLEWRLVQRSSR